MCFSKSFLRGTDNRFHCSSIQHMKRCTTEMLQTAKPAGLLVIIQAGGLCLGESVPDSYWWAILHHTDIDVVILTLIWLKLQTESKWAEWGWFSVSKKTPLDCAISLPAPAQCEAYHEEPTNSASKKKRKVTGEDFTDGRVNVDWFNYWKHRWLPSWKLVDWFSLFSKYHIEACYDLTQCPWF